MTTPTSNLHAPVTGEVILQAKAIIRTARTAALALIDRSSGAPLTRQVGLATHINGAPLFVMSDLSGNLEDVVADPRASLLIGTVGPGDPLAQARLSLSGHVEAITDDLERQTARRRYLARHLKASLYVDFADFRFFTFVISHAQYIGGFGKVYKMGPRDVMTDMTGFCNFSETEAGIVDHMNDDHSDAVALYATKLLGEVEGDWQLVGVDPDGMDLQRGDNTCRYAFPDRLEAPGEVKSMLIKLVRQARSQQSEG